MKKTTLFTLLAVGLNVSPVSAKDLTIERMTSSPNLAGSTAKGVKFSPDGTRVTFMRANQKNARVLDLWEYNIKEGVSKMLVEASSITGGVEKLSQDERARRERMRITNRGIVSYSWSEEGDKLLFPLGGDLYQYDLETSTSKRLTSSAEYEVDSRFSPKGSYASFTLKDQIYVVDVRTGKQRKLTSSKTETIKNGSAEFIAMEEMDRDTGYWWSPDEKYIAFIRYDEKSVEIGKRYEVTRDDFNVLEQRYPAAGMNNVHVELGIMNVKTKRTKWIDLGKNKDIYLPRVKWVPDSSGIFFQRQNRAQTKLELIFADVKARTKTVLTETAKYWINLNHSLKFFEDGSEFIWASERSGYNHLYHYKKDGTLINQLTKGKWVVTNAPHIDEAAGEVYFMATAAGVLERHLFKTSLSTAQNSHPMKITKEAGWHHVMFPEEGAGYIDKFSSPTTPEQMSLHKNDGSFVTWISENKMEQGHPYFDYMKSHIMPEFGSIKAEDGTDLHYRMYKPRGMKKDQKYPVVFALYGGPHSQLVKKHWSGGDWNQYLVQQGYIIFTLDNRGTYNRGVEFEGVIHRKLGDIEIKDQLAGAKFLKTLSYVDENRIAVQGHSYGGYMTIMAMFKAPDVFSVGISGAPVTKWDLYDTHYTERYLGKPQDNAVGYKDSNVFPYIKGLKGKLLIVHGMADDNVVFNNTSMLIDELQSQAIQFDFMAYPGQTHRLGADMMRKRHLLKTYERYLNDNLNN